MTVIRRGAILERRTNGARRTVVGFTTKPSPSEPSDGIRRARLSDGQDEVRVKVDHIIKSYKPYQLV